MVSYDNYCNANGLEPLRVGMVRRALSEVTPVQQRWVVTEDNRRFRCYSMTDDFEVLLGGTTAWRQEIILSLKWLRQN